MNLTPPPALPSDDEPLDHAALAELLLECAQREREHITALDLDGMAQWSRRREALAQRALDWSAREPVEEDEGRLYKRAWAIAAGNVELLKGAQAAVRQMIEGLERPLVSVYAASGLSRPSGAPSGSLIWRG